MPPGYYGHGRFRDGDDSLENINLDDITSGDEDDGGGGRGGGGDGRGGERSAGIGGQQFYAPSAGIPSGSQPSGSQPSGSQPSAFTQPQPPYYTYATTSQPPPPQVVPQALPTYCPPGAYPDATARQAAHAPATVPQAARSAAASGSQDLRPPAFRPQAVQLQVAPPQVGHPPQAAHVAAPLAQAGQAVQFGGYPPMAALPSGWGATQLVPGPPQIAPPPGGWPAAPAGGWTGQIAPAVSGPTPADSLAMLRNANEHIIKISQELVDARQQVAFLQGQEAQKKKGGRSGKVARGNEDDPDQPAELSGMKLKVRSDIRAYALLHSPWPPPPRALEYTYTPDFDPLDPYERYVSADLNEPRIETVVVQIRNFFPEAYLPFLPTTWMEKQFTSVINTFKSHIVSAVKGNAWIIFRHIPDLQTNKHYWGGTVEDRYPGILFPVGEVGNQERLGQNAATAKACRIMVHGRTAGEGDRRVRGNTNSTKWKLRAVTSGMVATVFCLLRYLLSDQSAFVRDPFEVLFFEYHRKILESMHKRHMKQLFAWLDLFVFGPGSDAPIRLTPEPCPVDDILLPEERAAHDAHAAASIPPVTYPPQQANADDNHLGQSDRSNFPHNSHSDNHGPLPPVPLRIHDHPAMTDVRYDCNNNYDNGGVRNLLDDAHGVRDAEVARPVHDTDDIRDDWHVVGDEDVRVGNAAVPRHESPRHDPRHGNAGLPAHHDPSYEEPRLPPPVSDAYAHGDGPVSRHVHFAQSTGERELSGGPVGAGAGSMPAASSSRAGPSSRITLAVSGVLTAYEQPVEADPVVQLTAATADLALQPPKKRGSRNKGKAKNMAPSAEDPEQASAQAAPKTRRSARSKGG